MGGFPIGQYLPLLAIVAVFLVIGVVVVLQSRKK